MTESSGCCRTILESRTPLRGYKYSNPPSKKSCFAMWCNASRLRWLLMSPWNGDHRWGERVEPIRRRTVGDWCAKIHSSMRVYLCVIWSKPWVGPNLIICFSVLDFVDRSRCDWSRLRRAAVICGFYGQPLHTIIALRWIAAGGFIFWKCPSINSWTCWMSCGNVCNAKLIRLQSWKSVTHGLAEWMTERFPNGY